MSINKVVTEFAVFAYNNSVPIITKVCAVLGALKIFFRIITLRYRFSSFILCLASTWLHLYIQEPHARTHFWQKTKTSFSEVNEHNYAEPFYCPALMKQSLKSIIIIHILSLEREGKKSIYNCLQLHVFWLRYAKLYSANEELHTMERIRAGYLIFTVLSNMPSHCLRLKKK